MTAHRFPRPPSVTAVGYVLIFYAFFWLVTGMFRVNEFDTGAPPVVIWTVIVLPPYCGLAAICAFRGVNFIRFIHWALVLASCVCVAIFWKDVRILTLSKVSLTLIVGLLTGSLLATGNAHWYFTKRDFRRRPGYKASFDRAEHATDRDKKKRYEY
jgi:hypothetical protein